MELRRLWWLLVLGLVAVSFTLVEGQVLFRGCSCSLEIDKPCTQVQDTNGTYCQTCKLLTTKCDCDANCSSGQSCDTVPDLDVTTLYKANNCSSPSLWWKRCGYEKQYDSLECETCGGNHYGPLCLPCPINCGKNGECNWDVGGDGTCICHPGFVGPACQFSRYSTCNNKGDPSPLGNCTCDPGWSPKFQCSSCLPNHYGTACTFCLPSSTCSGHGSCDPFGICNCSTKFTGASCSSCAPSYSTNYPTCTFCDDNITCNDRGTCDNFGSCVCSNNFTGPACTDCKNGFFGSECVYCPGLFETGLICTGRGTCFDGSTGNGSCKCNGLFRGSACDEPVVSALEPSSGGATGGYRLTISGLLFGQKSGNVSLGSIFLQVVSWTDIEVVAEMAAGLGAPLVKVKRYLDGTASNGLRFLFDSPFLELVQVCPCQAEPQPYDDPGRGANMPVVNFLTEGCEVQLKGTNFGPSAGGQVVLDGRTILNVTSWSATLIRAMIPPGLGFNHSLYVQPAGSSVATNVLPAAYGPPSIKQVILVDGAPTDGGTAMQLIGQNFGMATLLEVQVAGEPCTNVVDRNHTALTCLLPPGRGVELVELRLDVLQLGSLNWSEPAAEDVRPDRDGNGRIAEASTTITYDALTVTNLSGCPGGELPGDSRTTAGCNPYGGGTLTIAGTNFGTEVHLSHRGGKPSDLQVTVAGLNCSNVTMMTPHYQVVCLLPATSGLNVDVSVFLWPTQEGQLDSHPWLSYDTPLIFSDTLSLEVAIAVKDELDGDLFGKTTRGVNGTYTEVVGTSVLGGDELSMHGKFPNITTIANSQLTYGPTGSPALYGCTLLEANETYLRCQTAAGVGQGLRFRITVDGVGGEVGRDTFSYPAPVLVPRTIRSPGETLTTSVIDTGEFQSTLSNQGEEIELAGLHLGMQSSALVASLGPPDNLERFTCDVLFLNNTLLRCRISSGEGKFNVFKVLVGPAGHPESQQLAISNDTYSYPGTPSITSVSGCNECPTAGGVLITIDGEDFTSSGAQVRVGNVPCVNVQHLSDKKLTCLLPPGAGALQSVTVNKRQLYSQARPLVSYARPSLFSIEGCSYAPNDAAQVAAAIASGSEIKRNFTSTIDCPRAGGSIITIKGANLGASGATVLVGGQGCLDVLHGQNDSNSHSVLSCTLPPGSSQALTLLVIQKGGSISFDQLQLSYYPCQPGQREQVENVTCDQCQKGTFASQAGASVCEECSVGTYAKGSSSVCTQCSTGYFTSEVGKDQCQSCEAGKYAPALGSQSCLLCPVGKYTAIGGQANCVPCPLGQVQAGSGKTTCNFCQPGYFIGQSGQAICEPCVAGTFNTKNRSFACEQCPPGTSTDNLQAQTSCRECGNGTLAVSKGTPLCSTCPKGRYSNYAFPTTCMACIAGKYGPIRGAVSCELCSPGYYTGTSALTQCTPCAVGSAVNQSGQPRCDLCVAGRHQDLDGQAVCLDCLAGRFNPTDGQAQCSPCAVGSATNLTKRSYCSFCTKGKYSATTGEAYCKPCEKGFSSFTDGAPQCDPCAVGRYAAGLGMTSCLACPAGTVASSLGQSECRPCSPGLYISEQPAVQCATCAAGSFSANFSSTACTQCPPGYHQPLPGLSNCSICLAGSKAPQGSSSCSFCSGGFYQPAPGKSSCESCDAGYYSGVITGVGMTGCTACTPGLYSSSAGVDVCSPCDRGKFSTGFAQTSCVSCSPGYIATTPGQTSCTGCPPGKVQPVSGQRDCEPCNTGNFMPYYNGTDCQQCKEGRFAPLIESVACDPCEPGTYMPDVGASSCFACKEGSFASRNGSQICDPCPEGYYQDVEGSPRPCHACATGFFANGKGKLKCDSCLPGTFAVDLNSTSCSNCDPGRFSQSSSSSVCQDCISGTYSAEGSQGCLRCAAGTNSSDRAPKCEKCAAGRYNSDVGLPLCTACEAGKTSHPSGQFCEECPPGAIAPLAAWPSCLLCGANSEAQLDRRRCLCQEDFYGYKVNKTDVTETACMTCPFGFDCAVKGETLDSLKLLPGWWAANNSLKPYRCRNPFDCLGGRPGEANAFQGALGTPIICQNHHTGPLCSLCEEHYTKTSGGHCVVCESSPEQQRKSTSIAALLVMLTLVALFFGMLKLDNEKATNLRKVLSERYGRRASLDAVKPHLVVGRRGDQFWFGWSRGEGEEAEPYNEADEHLPLRIEQSSEGSKNGSIELIPQPSRFGNGLELESNGDGAFQGPPAFIAGTTDASPVEFSPGIQEHEEEPLPASAGPSSIVMESLPLAHVATHVHEKIVTENGQLTPLRPPEKKQDLMEVAAKVHSLQSWRDLQQHNYFKESTQAKIKILVTFFQIMTSLVFFLDYPWPTPYSGVIASFGFINFNPVQMTRSDCMIQMDYLSSWILMVTFPVLVMLVLMVRYLIPWSLCLRCICRTDEKKARITTMINRNTFVKLSLFWSFLIYPRMASSTLGIFQCIPVDGVDYLIHDFRVHCYTERWWRFALMDIGAILVYPVGIPFVSWWLLRDMHRRNAFDDWDSRYKLGFLYEAFAPDVWWFEIADISHKLIMTSLLAFFPRDMQVQVGMLTVTLYAIIIIIRVPYYRWSLQMLHLLAQTELLLFLMSGFTFFDGQKPLDKGQHLFISVVMLAVSAVFVVFFVYTVIKFARLKVRFLLSKRGWAKPPKIKKQGISTRDLLQGQEHIVGEDSTNAALTYSRYFLAQHAELIQQREVTTKDLNAELT
eukprot:gb/GEZN01000059.1/.p1 GENE.gb/GEZN01000059.1/~~gb/GEZN01000059.1/.p1  ORF type:complete len:2708 (-),score=174.89 gb/GEZN01000059.1/:523-8646(-)